MKIDIGGLSIVFNSQAQLKTAAEKTLGTTEARLKKAGEEFKRLRRARRALMQFLAERPAARKSEKTAVSGASGL